MDAGVTINRPPRDGRMAFVRSPDDISVELLQKGGRAGARRTLGVDAQHGRMVMLETSRSRPSPTITSGWSTTPTSGETAVVDPGDAAPALAEADARGWTITQVWNTHWHPDHTGGNRGGQGRRGLHRLRPGRAEPVSEVDRISRKATSPHRRHVGRGDRNSRAHARPRRSGSSRTRASPSSATRCSPWAAAGCSRAPPSRCTPTCSASPRCPTTPALLRARIYARQCAVRGPCRARQCGDRRAARAGRGDARGGPDHACRRRSPRNARPIPSFAPRTGEEFARLRAEKDSFR